MEHANRGKIILIAQRIAHKPKISAGMENVLLQMRIQGTAAQTAVAQLILNAKIIPA
jgi:hypothetical protein